MDLYTIDEAAQALGVHPRTVRRYIQKGQLRAERIGGVWRISGEALKAMFDTPELREGIAARRRKRTDDAVDLFNRGKHRLQKDASCTVLSVITFDPEKEPWMLATSAEWSAELNRLGKDSTFDFTMTGDEQGTCRWTLLAPLEVAREMLAELARLRRAHPVASSKSS